MKYAKMILLMILLLTGVASQGDEPVPEEPDSLLSLLSDSSCPISCWMGLTPNITTVEEVITLFEEENIEYEVANLGLNNDIFSYEVTGGYSHPLVYPEFADTIVIFSSDETISTLWVRLNHVSIEDMISTYGNPDYLLDSGNGVQLVYATQGLVFLTLKSDGNMVYMVTVTGDYMINRYTHDSRAEQFSGCAEDKQLCDVVTAILEENPTPFYLVDADTDTILRPLHDHEVIDLADEHTRNLNISFDQIGIFNRVDFTLNVGEDVSDESHPFTVFGDEYDDYFPWTPEPGTYTLTAIRYQSDEIVGEPYQITFTIVDSQ